LRSYSSQGGFGFIECPALGVDVWFAKHELPTDYQELTINELRGCTVTFVLRSSKEGKRQARTIEVVMQNAYPQGETTTAAAAVAAGAPPSLATPPPPPPSGGQSGHILGNIKSFEDDYGVIESAHVNGDVDFHRSDLPISLVDGVATLENGQPVLFRLEYASDGTPTAKNLVLVPMEEERLFGTVKTYNVNSGFGFIEPMQGSAFILDLYFHRADVPEALQMCKLDACQVSFLLKLTSDCKPHAKDILFLSSPSEVGGQGGEPDGTTGQSEYWGASDGNYEAQSFEPAEGGACKRPLDGSYEADGMPPSKRFASDQDVPEDSVGMAAMGGDMSTPISEPTADMSGFQTEQSASVPPPPPPPRTA